MFELVKDYTPYAGIGATKTPPNICSLMSGIAKMLYERGYTLRSGGAPGADQAFEYGTPAMSTMEIYLPWNRFEGKADTMRITEHEWATARSLAEKYHPNWAACSEGQRKFLIRDVFQVLGRGCDSPSAFIVCWTENGKIMGGTGQALRIADDKKIKVYNLHDPEVRGLFYTELGWEHDV